MSSCDAPRQSAKISLSFSMELCRCGEAGEEGRESTPRMSALRCGHALAAPLGCTGGVAGRVLVHRSLRTTEKSEPGHSRKPSDPRVCVCGKSLVSR